jgi:hypothetical protein
MLIAASLVVFPASEAASQSLGVAAVSLRYGVSAGSSVVDARNVALEGDIRLGRHFVATLEIGQWSFGFSCAGIGPCPSSVSTTAVGAKYFFPRSGPIGPYAGAALGRGGWASDVSTRMAVLRGGMDIRVLPHVAVSGEFRQFWFGGDVQRDMIATTSISGLSGGLKLFF